MDKTMQEGDAYLEELKRMFTRAQDLAEEARQQWQIDQDMYDGNQWTDEERQILAARKQPALVFNHIKPAINSTIGLIERGKTDPKAYGRTPKDVDAADVVTDCLRYIADVNRFQNLRAAAVKDMLIQGVCIATVEIDQDREIKIVKGRPEAFFYDPFSREPDFSDARFVGLANWMDECDVIDLYPDKSKEITESTNISGLAPSESYSDRPKNSWAWADSRTRRCMVVELHHRRNGNWYKTVFVAGAILETGPSPYRDQRNRPMCPLLAMSAYVDRDNRRYGAVRDMRGPQDAINKGRSKAVHLLNVNKLRVDPGVLDVDQVRSEYAKPDGIIEARDGQIEELGGKELLPAHIELLRDAKAEMQRQSPSPGIVGRQSASQSGRAILAEQQAGMTEMAPLLGRFDDWTLRIYRSCWSAVRQFWQEPQYIRVTDDEDAPKYIMMNEPALMMDPTTGQPVMDPTTGKPVINPNVPPRNAPAQMDVDIIIDSSPDVANLAEEQFQRIAELVQAGVPIPPEALIEASSLPRKRIILDKIKAAKDQASQAPDSAMQAEMQKADMLAQAKQRDLELQSQAKAQDLERQDMADQRKTERAMQLAELQFKFDIEKLNRQAQIETGKAQAMVELKRREKQVEIELDPALRAKQLDFEFMQASHEMDEVRRSKPVMEAAMPMLQAMAANMEAVGQALKKMASPRRLVKDPMTGEKRVEIIDTDMSMEDALASLGAPRRVVRDPVTGEKRTEIVTN